MFLDVEKILEKQREFICVNRDIWVEILSTQIIKKYVQLKLITFEVVEIHFDEDLVSYEDLLDIFWKNHNPTTLNRQGLDTGTQYRSVIYYTSDVQTNI